MNLYKNMKINNSYTINTFNNNPSFCGDSHEWKVFGIDEGGKEKREYIREWHDKNHIPYQSIYEREGRLSEYELSQLLGKLLRKGTVVNNEILNSIGLNNLEQLGDSNSYRGEMIKDYETEKLSMLKRAGIRCIVNLTNSPELEAKCNEFGVEYLHMNLKVDSPCMQDRQSIVTKSRRYWENIASIKDKATLESFVNRDIKNWSSKSRESIEELINFVKFMQKDNVYIWCACGTLRTDFAVLINSLFNPKANYDCSNYELYYLDSLKNLYTNLTESDKLKMGWTTVFDKQFMNRLNKLRV